MVLQQGRGVETPRHATLPTPREVIEQDAAQDGLSPRQTQAAFWAPFAVAAVLGVVFVVHRMWFYIWQLEDHPIEWAQFTLVLFASVAAGVAAVQFARSGRTYLAVLMILFALGCFVLAGEEISWGQRVFGLVTPADLASANQQDELNLHNIDVGVDLEDLFKIAEFVLGVVAIGLSLLARNPRGRLYHSVWWWVAPPLFTLPGYLAIAVYRAVMIGTPVTINPLIAFQEGVEIMMYFSLACTALAIFVRATPGRYLIDLTGDDARLTPQRMPNRTPLAIVFAALVVLTIVFAIMSAHSGILPGNLPGMSR